MKKIIILVLAISAALNLSAQETVTNRSGKEITVNKDATSTEKGSVKLTGDLGGTADAPTVPALSSKIAGTGTVNYIPKFTGTKSLGNSLLFDNGTYLGLGTLNPVSLFEISDASETFTGNGTLRISNSSNPTVNKFAGLVFKSNNVSGVGGSWKIGSNQESATSYEQNFHFLNSYNGSTYAPKMTLTPSGNVGIGTTAPANKLEITQGTAGNSGLRFTNLTSSSTSSTSSSKVLSLNSSGDVILTNVPGTQNIVAFSVNANPNTTGTTFSPDTPIDPSVVYQSTIDNSMWTYNGSTYVTYTAPASTAWFTSGTTNDAGNSKTSSIYRSGNVGIGMSTPSFPLDVRSAATGAYVSIARFQAPNITTAGQSSLLNFGVNSTTGGNSADWRFYYAGNGSSSNRVDFGMSGNAAPMMSYLVNGNVGIGTTAPLTKLQIQGPLATQTINADAQILRFSRAPQSNIKWDNIAQFNLGSYAGSPTITAKTRLDLAMNDGDGVATSNVMTWQANGNVGINTTAPSAPLVIQGLSGQGSLKFTAPVVNASGDNWWMGFGHGTISTDANDRARIGVDILSGGAGRLFFTTGATGSQTRAMFIDENQRVGIGTSAPTSNIEVNGSVAALVRSSSVSTTTSNDFTLLMSTAGTIVTLEAPTAVTRRIMAIKNTSAGTINVTGHIDGTASSTIVLMSKESIEIQSDGTTWQIIAKFNLSTPIAVTAQLNPMSIPNNSTTTLMGYVNVTDSSQGAWDATTGIYTVNKAGIYRVEFRAMVAQAAWTQGYELAAIIYKNATSVYNSSWFAPYTGTQFAFSGNAYATMSCAVGDQIKIGLWHASGAAKTTYSKEFNIFSIYEIR